MQLHDVFTIADNAVSGNSDRAATAIVHDSPDARFVVFRIDAGQTVPLHSSTSSVTLSVIRGSGIISGPVDGVVKEHAVHTGNVATYEPGELHGMHADAGTFVVLATIAPRPGTRRGAQAA
jgi:quercetin dioxygenase-like cupin family protein